MEVEFTRKTDKDFRRHRDYLRRIGKSDGHKYQKYELDGISKSLKSNISKGLIDIKEHKDSIFPKEFEYHSDSHKMYVDKKSHHIIFYTIETKSDGERVIKVRKCIHSIELKKELEEKGIKPLKDCDKSLLDDLETVYREDDVKSKDDSEDEKETKEEKEEVTDPETSKKIKKVKHTGPRGGHYYINDKGEHIYPEEWNESIKNMKSVKSYITESKIVSLIDYLKKMVE